MNGPGQPLDWSPGGRYLLYRTAAASGAARGATAPAEVDMDLMALPLDGDRQPFPIVNTRFRESQGKFSPDGRWIAHGSTETGRMEIYVQAFGGAAAAERPAGRWQISNAGGSEARWRADSRELYYLSDNRHVMGPSPFDISLDGRRFVVIEPGSERPPELRTGHHVAEHGRKNSGGSCRE